MNKTPINSAEQFIKDCTKTCSNEIVAKEPYFHEWVTPEQALKAIEIAREEWLSNACKWLKENAVEYIVYVISEERDCLEIDRLLDNFKKAMEN